jgi:hypothetical protein
MSSFHTEQIRALEKKCWLPSELTPQDFVVIPPINWKNPNKFVFCGVFVLIGSILIPVYYKLVGACP